MVHIPSHDDTDLADRISCRPVCLDRGLYGLGQSFIHPLVCIKIADPVSLSLLPREIALAREAAGIHIMLDDPGSMLLRNGLGRIRAAGINDDHFIRETDRCQTSRDIIRFIPGEYQYCKLFAHIMPSLQ
jgi:hypothetical protein